jgi:hypothetical protein
MAHIASVKMKKMLAEKPTARKYNWQTKFSSND